MVFFTCNVCGESLKKNKVEKHLFQCRTKSLSCMDCGKDFIGKTYNSHNECVSEDQKYGGIDFKAKEGSQKGKAKQEIWIQKVKNAIIESKANPHINELMQKLLGFDNIPRKKPKFFNFVKNCMKVRNEYYIQQLWDIFESVNSHETNNSSIANNNETETITNGNNKRPLNDSDLNDTNAMKKYKEIDNKSESFNEEQCDESTQNSTLNSNSETSEKLKMKKIITNILKSSENNEISIKKLKKKVLKLYKSNDNNYCKEDIVTKFEDKLYKHKKLSINDGKVSLIKKL